MKKPRRKTSRRRTSPSQVRARKLAAVLMEYRVLLGRIVEALGFYDSDDGHNDLVLAGIASEFQRLDDQARKLGA